ncbi:MAG: lipid-A-disaccharide synthase [bacterium]
MGRSNLPRKYVKLVILAGEVSGDVQGASLASELLNNRYKVGVSLYGIGGEYMKRKGVKLWGESTRYGSVGFLEPLRFLPRWFSLYRKVKDILTKEQFDGIIFIDNQGFNMEVARFIKKKGLNIPMFYYFSPQVWLWGKKIAEDVKKLGIKVIAVFLKELDVYRQSGVDVYFVGHPILDVVAPSMTPEKIRKNLGIKDDLPLIGLFPGSRYQEVRVLLPIMLEAILPMINKEAYFYVASASDFTYKWIMKILERYHLYIPIIRDNRYDYMNASSLLVMASGTAVLEAAILEVPSIALYKLSWLSWMIAKRIIHYPYATMPNILLGRPVIKELIQNDAKPEKLRGAIRTLIENQEERRKIKEELASIREVLGEKGATKRAVDYILKELDCIE